MEDGLYEFKVNSTLSHEMFYFYRILVINEAKYPEFKEEFSRNGRHTIPAPVSYSSEGDSYQIDSLYLWAVTTDIETGQPLVWMDNNQQVYGKIYLNEPYVNVPKILDLEIYK